MSDRLAVCGLRPTCAARTARRAPFVAAPAALAVLLAACASGPAEGPAAGSASTGAPAAAPVAAPRSGAEREVTVQRTAQGVAHVTAPDFESLAYGMAYAYAQDNVCLTAQHLVTVRGERARTFGVKGTGLLGLRRLPNEIVDLFVAVHMDDASLARAAATQSPDAQALARGYVAGYNRYLADHAGRLPAECRGAAWVKPMTEAEYRRIGELSAVQAGVGALADSMLSAAPPRPAGNTSALPMAPDALARKLPAGRSTASSSEAAAASAHRIDIAAAADAMREAGLLEPPFGSNAWAFGRETTGGAGVLLGNPHFPWEGVNRFW